MISLFFSYSHKDESFRDELEIHLAMLKREGFIEAWHDRRIDAGAPLHNEISDHLESAAIILLLVSPYFLASDYCYDREMVRALERHAKGEAVVIPVIVHPCDWMSSAFSHLRVTPPDGKPISKFPNHHDAYLAVVTDVRKAIAKTEPSSGKEKSLPPSRQPGASFSISSAKRSSNLRLKREFTDHEKDAFLDGAYEFISNYFENSLHELKARNKGIDFRFKRDGHEFTAAVYRNGSKECSCKIWLGDRGHFPNGIAYSSDETGSGVNESLSVEGNGYSLFLRPLMSWRSSYADKEFTEEGAAEHLWTSFIERLQ
ncbi:MAG: toll/interleukin-1 receptor domain-containing protein [Nitrospirota bacterium]